MIPTGRAVLRIESPECIFRQLAIHATEFS